MSKKYSPDAHTAAFLTLLDPSQDKFCFRTFADPKDSDGSACHFDGTIEVHKSRLSKLNSSSAGVFVVVNSGGHRDADITKIRAVFADTDGAPLDPILTALKPHMVVETSPGRWHVYWLVSTDFPVRKFKRVQSAIAKKFGCDTAVCNTSRVMRLPGFDHCKQQPFPVRFTKIDSKLKRYNLDEIISGLELKIPSNVNFGDLGGTPPSSKPAIGTADAEAALRHLNPFVPRQKWMGVIFAIADEFGEGRRALAHRWSDGSLLSGGKNGSA